MTLILVVEDNPMNLQLMETILSHHGFQYLVAVDGETGVQLAGENQFDLVLMDMQLPGIDGFEAMKRIRQLAGCETLAVVAVTGNTTAADSTMVLEAGFDAFIGKPYTIDELLACINTLLGYSE